MPLTDTPTQAELAEAQACRAAVGRRADQIRRRRVGAIAGVVAILVLVVVVPLALTRSAGRSEGVVTTVPTSPTTETTTTSTAKVGATTAIGPVTVTIPRGWGPLRYNPRVAVAPHAPFSPGVCLVPSPTRTTAGLIDCPGLWLVSPEGGTPLLDSSSGHLAWHMGTGMDCPFSDAGVGLMHGDGIEVAHGFRPVGNLTAEWEEWTVSCVGGPTHHVQVWLLPDSNVLFVTASDSPEIAQILATARHRSVDEYPVQVTAGQWAGRNARMLIYPDGTGELFFADRPPCSSPGASRPCHPSPPDGYTISFTVSEAVPGSGGKWSADATIDGDNSHGDRPSLEGLHVHLVETDGKVTITGGGFVAGFYPNGQLCATALRGATTNRGCP